MSPDAAAPARTPALAWRTFVWAALLAAVVMGISYAALWAPRDLGQAAPIWPGNALAVTCVLRGRRDRWWVWMLAATAGNLGADLAVGDSLTKALVLTACNSLEIAICGLGIPRLLRRRFDPSRMADLAWGGVVAVGASFVAAFLASAYVGVMHGGHFVTELIVWMMADLLGLLILVPCLSVLADWRLYLDERPLTWVGLATVVGVVLLQIAIFAQSAYPLLFLAPMAMLAAAMVLELLGAAIVVMATAAVAMGFTFAGVGPITLAADGWTGRLILLQVFVAASTGLGLQIAAMHQHRRRSARELAAALAEAEQASRVKSEFLANMSHEIRTPLTSILGFASLLAEQDLGDEAGRYAARVLAASRSLLALVNDVLDFSKLEAGRLELKPQVASPRQCGRDVADLFSAQAAEKGLALRFVEADLPAHVTADFDRVRQVLINLVGNAVKFTRAGEVVVRAGYDAGAGRLGYRVADTGPGLDADAQALLFQRFSQVDAAVNRAHAGSGLGLAISKGLVEAMGGRIGVESTPGVGSTFWFEIPAPAAEAEVEAEGANLDLAAFQGLKILLVDDNAANRELIRSLLSPLGVALTTADGGEASIAVSRMQEFQLILMDLRMPGVDGWTAARAIRGEAGLNQATPMLAFSADITAGDEAALDVFEGVVRKPIEMAELLFAIARWTGPSSPPAGAALASRVVKTPQRRR